MCDISSLRRWESTRTEEEAAAEEAAALWLLLERVGRPCAGVEGRLRAVEPGVASGSRVEERARVLGDMGAPAAVLAAAEEATVRVEERICWSVSPSSSSSMPSVGAGASGCSCLGRRGVGCNKEKL
jgi:hypothetical protein